MCLLEAVLTWKGPPHTSRTALTGSRDHVAGYGRLPHAARTLSVPANATPCRRVRAVAAEDWADAVAAFREVDAQLREGRDAALTAVTVVPD